MMQSQLSWSRMLRLLRQQSRTDLRTLEWRSLLLALILATTLAGFLTVLGHQLEQGLSRQSAAVLGADLTLSDARPPAPEVIQQARSQSLALTEVVQFSSMISQDEQLLLSSIRAVNAPYPLRGEIVTAPQQSSAIPPPGTAWAEQTLLDRLNAEVGSRITLGYQELLITAAIVRSPDRGTGFRSFSPQLIINRADLDATGVIQPGSRIGYRLLFSGDEASIRRFSDWLEPQLNPQQRLASVYTDQPMADGAMKNASGFLRLSSLFGLLLCGLLISLCLRRYSSAQQSRCALLKSLGMQHTQILQFYLLKLLSGWAIAAIAGTLLSQLLLFIAHQLLQSLIPGGLPDPSPEYYLVGPVMSLALLLILGFSPLLQISNTPVMGLLRQELLRQNPLTYPARIVLILLLGAVLALYLDSLLNALLALLLIGLCTLLAGVIAATLLPPLARQLAKRFKLGRLLLYRLRQQRQWHRIQLGIMSLLLALLCSLFLSQTELVERWQNQLPEDTPNQFVINIQPWEVQAVGEFLQQQSVEHTLYPMIRGRVTGINGLTPEQALSEQQMEHNALHRELNLSWSADRPAHNPLTRGRWWSSPEQPEISVEQEFAETLGLQLGDQMTFELAGQQITATITSVRQVEWRSFKPNFYVIFSPGALENYPQTFITSFRLSSDEAEISRALLKQFPALTLIDVGQWIDQANTLINQLIQASTIVLGLTLAAGILLVQLLLHQELEQRRHENALLQVLGSTPGQTLKLDLLEFTLLGLLSGVMAALLSELLTGLIGLRLLELPLVWHPAIWLLLPLSGAVIFLLGTLGAHRKSGYWQLRQS